MPRNLKVVVLGLVIAVAVVLAFGSKEGAKAQALQEHGSSAAQRTIYPAGGSDGPPNL